MAGTSSSDSFGLGCIARAVSSVLGSFSQGPSLLLVTRFFEGLGYIFMVVSVPGLILRVVNQRDSRVAFGFWGSFMPAGGAMMILAPLLMSAFGWRGMWLTVKTPSPILLALCFGTYGFQLLVVMRFLPTLLIEQQGMNQGVASVLTAIALAISVPGNLLGGWLLQRGIKRWLLIAVASVTMDICAFGIFSGSINLLLRYSACIVFMGIN